MLRQFEYLSAMIFLWLLLFVSTWGNSTFAQDKRAAVNYDVDRRSQNAAADQITNLGREKRVGADTALGIASFVLGAVSFIYGVAGGESTGAKIDQIQNQLNEIENKIDTLSSEVSSQMNKLKSGQNYVLVVTQFTDDVRLLKSFLHNLNTRVSPAIRSGEQGDVVTKWADLVLSVSDKGISFVMKQIDDMMMGRSAFSGRKLFNVYDETMDPDSTDYTKQIRSFKKFTFDIQIAGYAAWAIALNTRGKSEDVPSIQELAKTRLTAQEDSLAPLTLEWPSGTYGLPKAKVGCPRALGVTWATSIRYHCTGNNNEWTHGNHLSGEIWSRDLKQEFCMVDHSTSTREWPKGNYCIYMRAVCPPGFREGWILWDEEDHSPYQTIEGSGIPRGVYERKITKIYFCCRDDGSSSTEIDLPFAKPFYLMRFTGPCQRVKNTNVVDEFIYFDEVYVRDLDERMSQVHPERGSDEDNHKIHYCYYTPKNS